MRRERPTAVHDGDTRTLSVVVQIDTAPGCSSSWRVEAETVDRQRHGGRPKRQR